MTEKTQKKIRVAVLYGGRSAEHEVSLQSAKNVIENLDSSRFDVVPMGIDKQGKWFLGQDTFNQSLTHNYVKSLPSSVSIWFTPEWVGTSGDKQDVTKINQTHTAFDVLFPVVHGTLCEDGTLQGLLELADLPYVGCGVLASAVGMDKDVSKRLVMQAGIKVPPYFVIRHADWQHHPEHYQQQIKDTFGYPVFVKPANTGSSIGINKVKNDNELLAAVKEAFRFDRKILIEKALNVIELEVAVLEALEPGADPIVSVVGEVRPNHEFYSYHAKYIDENGAELLIPAPIDAELIRKAQEVAKRLFVVLECEGMVRVDLFLTKDTQEIYFNEVNTIPGFTQISMYPKLMNASGISYRDLLTHLVQLALNRYEHKTQLSRTYAD